MASKPTSISRIITRRDLERLERCEKEIARLMQRADEIHGQVKTSKPLLVKDADDA